MFLGYLREISNGINTLFIEGHITESNNEKIRVLSIVFIYPMYAVVYALHRLILLKMNEAVIS